MKIREKIFVGFALYVFLASVIGILAYRELRTVSTRLRLVETADDITNTILEVRRYEKLFLLIPDNDSRRQVEEYLTELRMYVDSIQEEIIREIGRQNHDMMRTAIREYEVLFEHVAATVIWQGELVGQIRAEGRRIEQVLANDAFEAFLEVRKEEKNLMLYEDQASYQAFSAKLESPALAGRQDVQVYRDLIRRLAVLFEKEHESISAMRMKAREIQSFSENLEKQEREGIEKTLRRSIRMLVIALSLVIVLGVIINRQLAVSIASPVRSLEAATRQVARGDFSAVIPVRGNDEIASLQRSFNLMQEKLSDALTSLERTIRELREKQDQLVEAEKLASVGIFAAGIAHEINNPLTSVLTFSNLMLEQTPEESPHKERLRMMVRETVRARHIVRQLLSFARETPLKLSPVNINAPVREIIDSLDEQGLFRDISLNANFADDLPEVSADAGRIGQVVLNILLNAVHAITPPGVITVETRRNAGFVEVAVTDTGSGIPEENLGRIFDPFFTTKEQDRGTGLGLAVSYGIMKKHGGEITVSSAMGRGATFTLRLPVHEEA